MHIRLTLTGVTGLVMHNVRLADARDEYTRAIAEITKKSKKTDDDYLEIERLEWLGGIYFDAHAGLYVPSWNVIRCLERGGTVTKQGTAVVRALAVMNDKACLNIGTKMDIRDMVDKPEYRFRATVGVQRSKVTRVRPIFRAWSVTMDAELLTDVLSLDDFTRIARTAGMAEGLGDARKLGYGRFTADVAAA